MRNLILLVDDEQSFLKTAGDILEDNGYEVVKGTNGIDGLAKARKLKPALIIMDIIMPQLTGYEFVQELKLDLELQLAPIIVTTEYNSLIKFFSNHNVDGFLLKSEVEHELIPMVRRCIGEAEGRHILIVDDEPEAIRSLRILLRQKRYSVMYASNGQEALERLNEQRVDLILLDIYMPVMDGCECLKAIKKDPCLAAIPVIAFSARTNLNEYLTALDVDDIITKPFVDDDVLARIQFLLRKKVALLCDNDEVAPDIIALVGIEVFTVKTEAELHELLKKMRFYAVIAYLGTITSLPHDFVSGVHLGRNSSVPLWIYCDSLVPGMQRVSLLFLDGLKKMWCESGADEFFDLRIAGLSFPELFWAKEKEKEESQA